MTGSQLAAELGLAAGMRFGSCVSDRIKAQRKQSVLILGVNGFIGNALSQRLLDSGKYEVHGMDLRSNYIQHLIDEPDFHFEEGDIAIHGEWIEYHIKKCDIVIPWWRLPRRSNTPQSVAGLRAGLRRESPGRPLLRQIRQAHHLPVHVGSLTACATRPNSTKTTPV